MELMELFYSNWMKGYDIRSAFDKTQTAMSEKYPPYFLAAFVLVGNVVETKEPMSKIPWWILGLGAISLIGLFRWRMSHTSKAA